VNVELTAFLVFSYYLNCIIIMIICLENSGNTVKKIKWDFYHWKSLWFTYLDQKKNQL